jgi:P4 family phage/plasmid primase-like protien
MKHSKNMTKLLKDINNATYINGILKFMKDLYTNNVIDDLIDNKPNLIAFTDKVFDSEKLEFRDIKKDDYICKTTKYNYDKSDKVIRKDIKDVLHSIFEDKEVEDYYLRIKSESLFGNKLQSFIMQVGSGGNGKGILSTIETKSLGDYVKTTENTFLTSAFKQGSANPTLASSKGLRALIISEPSEEDDNGKQTSLNTPFLKLITGGDDITTRGLFQSNITFKALFTPFLQCNTLPCMKKIDKGIMRRVKVIKYPLSFVENPAKSYERKIDYSLQEKFEQVKYAREYLLLLLDTFKTSFDKDNKKIDILTPEKVKEETNNYFIDSNPVKVYLDAFIEITGDKNDKIKSSTLKEDYDDHSDTKLSMPSFIKGMTANGVDNYMSMGYRYFRGIKMKVAQPKPEPEPEPEPKPEQKPKKLIKRLI